jgi:hypothetical protein
MIKNSWDGLIPSTKFTLSVVERAQDKLRDTHRFDHNPIF